MMISMGLRLETMPLFPLHTVLFPYAQIRLHIFEERYKEMISECVEFEKPLGIVLIRSGDEVGSLAEPYLIGTAVHIEKVEYFNDGQLDIQIIGERRFRIRELDDSRNYLVGKVEPLIEHVIDEGNEPFAESLFLQAREEFSLLVQKLFSRQEFKVQVVFPSDPMVLSFTIANLLAMENLEKQRLLETTDTVERIQALIPLLQLQNMEMRRPKYQTVEMPELEEWICSN